MTSNLFGENPDKPKELQAIFKKKALAYNVCPLDDRLDERFNNKLVGRPDLMSERKSLTLADGMEGILENTFLNVKNTSKTIEADVTLHDKGGNATLYLDSKKVTEGCVEKT